MLENSLRPAHRPPKYPIKSLAIGESFVVDELDAVRIKYSIKYYKYEYGIICKLHNLTVTRIA